MSESSKEHEIVKVNYYLLLKSFFLGVMLTEIGLCIATAVLSFEHSFMQNQKVALFWFIIYLYITFLMVSIYFARKDLVRRFKLIIKSKRIDILILFVSGIALMLSIGGIGMSFFEEWVGYLSWLHTFLLLIIPIIFFVAIIVGKLNFKSPKNDDRISSFISDKEGINKSDDAFGFFEMSKRFSERVYNQGSPESLVFGIDAPWGTGKSTFINLCKEHWNEIYSDKIVVYTFDPLRFENSDNILGKFVDGLLKVIRLNFFAPELESLISKYIKLLNDAKMTFSIFGVRFGIPFDNSSIDTTFNILERTLKNVDKKIIIIVDDLDRLDFASIKEILFVIKKSFILPNISYVLCYDTENITALEQQKLDTEKIIEFLEKFINIKISLYLDHHLLLNYFTDYKNEVLSRNLLSNTELVAKAVEGLKNIFEADDYHLYMPFIGDARKLKRLVNTIIVLEVEQVDFSDLDFDKHDLIHLLIIYINYPVIFRKIYNTESHGKNGFFSVLNQDGKSELYKNSTKYIEYIESLTKNQSFILNKIFDVTQRLNSLNPIPEEKLTSYACFNGSIYNIDGRNLEQYLNLIVKVSKPVPIEQYKFYLNRKTELLNQVSINELMKNKNFLFGRGEETHHQFFRVLLNSSQNEFTVEKSNEIINYLLDSLPKYSTLEVEGIKVGLRNFTLPFFLVKFLDKIGWINDNERNWYNYQENIFKIAEWIFGENDYKNRGIIETLAKKERGILGFHDLLKFRLLCSSNRGGDIYNLSRSLYNHGMLKNPTMKNENNPIIEEMREISQAVFKIFEDRYIERKVNIFEEVLQLSSKELCGDSYTYIKSNNSSDILDTEIKILKSKILAFIIYQMGNRYYENGVTCGYYDIQGYKDERGINININKYLFNICFNPKLNEKAYDHFLYCLSFNYADFLGSRIYRYSSYRFLEIFDKEQLTNYWEKHKKSIKSRNFNLEDIDSEEEYKSLYLNNLQEIYVVLDQISDDN